MPQYRYTLSNMTFSDSDELSDSTYEYDSEDSDIKEDFEDEAEDVMYKKKIQTKKL